MRRTCIERPTPQRADIIKEAFAVKGLPNCMGAIDGSHFKIKQPSVERYEDYYCVRKNGAVEKKASKSLHVASEGPPAVFEDHPVASEANDLGAEQEADPAAEISPIGERPDLLLADRGPDRAPLQGRKVRAPPAERYVVRHANDAIRRLGSHHDTLSIYSGPTLLLLDGRTYSESTGNTIFLLRTYSRPTPDLLRPVEIPP